LKQHIILLVIVSFILCAASLSCGTRNGDISPGYSLYTFDSTEGPFSFEYPEKWGLEVYPSSLWKGVQIVFGSNSPRSWTESEGSNIFLASVSQTPKHFSYSNAHELIQQQLDYSSELNEFHFIGKGKIRLGKETGEWVTFSGYKSYLSSLAWPPEYRHITCRHVAVDYKGRTYWLRQEVNTDLDSYEEYKPGFDHILKTFKFLN
jgi:hypothetical protein